MVVLEGTSDDVRALVDGDGSTSRVRSTPIPPSNRDVAAELAMVADAFERPTLGLLRSKWAAVQVSVLRLVFSQEVRSVPAEVLHTRVGMLLDALRADGVESPDGTGRELCRQWTTSKWLRRNPLDGREVYELTAGALDALEVVARLSSERQLLSESRIAAIVDAVRRQAIEGSPDAQPRIDRLNSEIERLTEQRDRLIAGEAPEMASDDRMLEGYHHLIDLIGQLPSDFKRVEEEMRRLRDSILTDLRDDTRPIGDTIVEYLSRSDRLLDTPEGRAFDGACNLLRDEVMLVQLSNDLDVVLAHPFTEVLTVSEVRAFRGTVAMVQRGLKDVLAQRKRCTQTIADRIRHHDAVRERELAAMLSELRGVLSVWAPTSKVHARVDMELLPERVGALRHVRERFYDPGDHLAPDPLADPEEAVSAMSLSEILRQGGPLIIQVRDALVASAGEGRTLAECFDGLPEDLRRPVEVLGVMHLLALVDGLNGEGPSVEVEAVRSDGSRRQLLLPKAELSDKLGGDLERLDLR